MMANCLQLSMRELLAALVLFSAVAASFTIAGSIASVLASMIAVLIVGIAIRGAVLPGRSRAFTIGFLIPASAYMLVVFFIGETEFQRRGGSLPTSQLFQSLVPPRFVDSSAKAEEKMRNAKTLMPLGHLLIAFISGYVGGKYAAWLHCAGNSTGGATKPDSSSPA